MPHALVSNGKKITNPVKGVLKTETAGDDAEMKEEKGACVAMRSDNSGKIKPRVDDEATTYRAILRRVRKPLRPPPAGSSGLGRTRSIFDMTLIHGISRLTMADMADKTPLYVISQSYQL
jgi:hypothetical protein